MKDCQDAFLSLYVCQNGQRCHENGGIAHVPAEVVSGDVSHPPYLLQCRTMYGDVEALQDMQHPHNMPYHLRDHTYSLGA